MLAIAIEFLCAGLAMLVYPGSKNIVRIVGRPGPPHFSGTK